MNDSLSIDQLDALAQIGRAGKQERPSACVSRNAKTLIGLKYASHQKDGQLALTEKGQQALFVRRCIAGLRAVSQDPNAALDADVVAFLNKKGHITESARTGFELTTRGRESLLDIEASAG